MRGEHGGGSGGKKGPTLGHPEPRKRPKNQKDIVSPGRGKRTRKAPKKKRTGQQTEYGARGEKEEGTPPLFRESKSSNV